MRILVVNDDGIEAAGIIRLAALAKEFGEVWVVAPDAQCSAMSQRITVRGELQLRKRADFPVEGVEAYSLSGTPADCVKVAVEYLMKDQLDRLFRNSRRYLGSYQQRHQSHCLFCGYGRRLCSDAGALERSDQRTSD